jgi:hypothetical protein
MKNERRQFERSAIEKAASYGIPEESLMMNEARILDVSAGGFCIQSHTKLERKPRIQLVFEVENHEECVIFVKIRWEKLDPNTGMYIYGVQITEPHQAEYNKLLAFIDKFEKPTDY